MNAQWKNVHPTREQPVILNARGEPIRALFKTPEKRTVGFQPIQSNEKEAQRAA